MKKTQLVSPAVWEKYLKKQEIDFVKKIRRAKAESWPTAWWSRRSRLWRPRSPSATANHGEAEEEVDMAAAGGVQCFNSEITEKLSTMTCDNVRARICGKGDSYYL